MCSPNPIRLLAFLLLVVTMCSGGRIAQAQVVEDKPDELKNVGVDQKLGAQVPLNLKFRNIHGTPTTLDQVFTGERPVLLTLNYSDCPMLCRVQLSNLVQVLREMEWTTGQEFDVLSVSVDPKESPEQANLTHRRYVQEYGRAEGADGWVFLVGDERNIRALADAVGFRYTYVEDTQEYAHSAAVMVMSPDGVVTRYLNGVMYDQQTIRLSLVEASEGKVGSAMDLFFLSCFAYDHTKGRYGPQAARLMQYGAATTVVVLAIGLVPYWIRRQRIPAPATTPTPGGADTSTTNDSVSSEPIS